MQHPTLISNGTEDSATYDFEWEFPETDADYEFHVIICAPQCREIIRAALEKDLQYPFEYYTDYTVTVKTVYYLPLNQTVTRLSNTMKGKSSVGAPGPIEVRNIEQRLNKLLLKWEPPKMTRGPISHYEVKATDAFNAEVENTWVAVDSIKLVPWTDVKIGKIRASFREDQFQETRRSNRDGIRATASHGQEELQPDTDRGSRRRNDGTFVPRCHREGISASSRTAR